MIDILSYVFLIGVALEVILFFKLWRMTNNVFKIKKEIEQHYKEKDPLIREAQIKALNGEKEEALKLYQKAFYLSVIDLYNQTVDLYRNEENENQSRDNYYEKQYSLIVRNYSKMIEKLGTTNIQTEKFDTYKKINSLICKS